MIHIEKVSMYYGTVQALNEVSFDVQSNEILGLLGPNGAGKSTLMKILTTFIVPFAGQVKINGFDIIQDPLKVRECVGYLPETVPLYMDMRTDEYLSFVAQARGLNQNLLKKRFDFVVEACGLKTVLKHNINELSKGFKQRVGLAQAIIHDPKVLILDEPTNGLDPLQIIEIRHLIRDLAKTKTIIFSSHILQEVEAISDRIVIIHEGKMVAQGTQKELAQACLEKTQYQNLTLENIFITFLSQS